MDMLEERQGVESSTKIINLVREKKLTCCISALTIPILWFLTEKNLSETEAKTVVHEIVKGFSVTPLNTIIINEAFKSKINDFEDAIQLYSAIKSKSEFLITRNKKDFESNKISILTPEEFLNTITVK